MRDLRILLLAAGLTGSAAFSGVPPYSRLGKVFVFPFEDGRTVLTWVSASTFRFCRDWSGQECSEKALNDEEVDLKEHVEGDRVVLRTQYLSVEVEIASGMLRVTNSEGRQVLADSSPVRRLAGEVFVERTSPPEERFHGLGMRTDPWMDGRGRKIQAPKPFLVSSLGYGLHHSSPGSYEFDLASINGGKYRISARGSQCFEYYFHYGPTPKEILEEHKGVIAPPAAFRPWHFSILHERHTPKGVLRLPSPAEASWDSLRDTVRSLVHSSMSAILAPAMDIDPYQTAPVSLYRRAMQLAAVAPLVCSRYNLFDDEERLDIHHEMTEARKRLNPFFVSYSRDVEGRGHPIIHALPLQFPRDPAAANIGDEFMLGDEILVAPIVGPVSARKVYLPMGQWTEIRSNRRFPGRTTVEMDSGDAGPILLAKNGSIVPFAALAEDQAMELHYFPKLAAEFFVFEPESNDYTLLHAGPAGDQMRLEIESKASRTYEWTVHHSLKAAQVMCNGRALPQVGESAKLDQETWHYDSSDGTLRIRVNVPTQKQSVVFVSFGTGGG